MAEDARIATPEKWEEEFFECGEDWNMYFNDAGGNILEFIARHDLPGSSTGDFGRSDILGISEIGIVVSDVPTFVEQCIRESGMTPFHGYTHPQFTALGDDHGLLIVVPEGRPWFPENRVGAVARPATVWIGAQRNSELEQPPNRFRFCRVTAE
ncbi:MAG: hypothetical protein ACR2IE_16980 [Candidatus Sumerlaeaceae bacterium]